MNTLGAAELTGMEDILSAAIRSAEEKEKAWIDETIKEYDDKLEGLDEAKMLELTCIRAECFREYVAASVKPAMLSVTVGDYLKACYEALKKEPKNRQECEERAACAYIICLFTSGPNLIKAASCGVRYGAAMAVCQLKFKN